MLESCSDSLSIGLSGALYKKFMFNATTQEFKGIEHSQMYLDLRSNSVR